MVNFIARLIPDGLIRAQVLKLARWLGTMASAWLITWLTGTMAAHGVDTSGALGGAIQNVGADAGALVTAIGMLAFSIWDAKKVDKKIAAVANAGGLTEEQKTAALNLAQLQK